MDTKNKSLLFNKLIAIIVCGLLFSACGKKSNVVLYPEYETTNCGEMFQFSKIELTDTATIIYADVYNEPGHWISISSKSVLQGEHDSIYKLLYSNGFELDKQVPMPDSGYVSFSLVFQPIAKTEKTVSFYENINNRDYFSVEGIKLYNVVHKEPVKCVLKGEVIDRPYSKLLMLLSSGGDARTEKVKYIPIREGKFEYILYTDAEASWQLIFADEYGSGWRPIDFIAESGIVNFVLHPMDDYKNNIVSGGKYNTEYQEVNDSIEKYTHPLFEETSNRMKELKKDNKFYTDEFLRLQEQLRKVDFKDDVLLDKYYKMQMDGSNLMPKAQEIYNRQKEIFQEGLNIKLDYSRQHTDIVGYTLLVDNIREATGLHFDLLQFDLAPMFAVFHELYETKYSKHPYTLYIRSCIQADSIAVGKPFPNITATDADGNEVSVSELIKGKLALVHLWASWCGPCRKHGMAMIPVYEKYKDKGFTVVGIARENNKNSMPRAVERDKYPWVNLLELNDEHSTWTILGVGNGGGAEFLVDAEGNFLAVGTNIEEMTKILEEKLK
jgi:thiol-disulfide isomerase/thioredoxin